MHLLPLYLFSSIQTFLPFERELTHMGTERALSVTRPSNETALWGPWLFNLTVCTCCICKYMLITYDNN